MKRIAGFYEQSIFAKKLDRFSENIEEGLRRSFAGRAFSWLGKALRQSSIARWFLRPDKEIDVFSTSRSVKKGVDVIEKDVRKAEKAYENGFTGKLLSGLQNEIKERPVYAISLVVLSAAAANTMLWFILGSFEWKGLAVRAGIILLALAGLNIRKNLKELAKGSWMVKVLRS